jgi:hypothetical protein
VSTPGAAVPSPATNSKELLFTFEGTTAGAPFTDIANLGTANTTQTIKLKNGASLISRRSATTGGGIVDYPAYDGGQAGARAAVAVQNAGTTDAISPGAKAFTMGADTKLDATNEGSAYDDGNNIFQRGLYTDAAQMKLQIDAGRFSCRVKGDLGAIEKWSPLVLTTGAWYRATCTREALAGGDRLVLVVAPLKSDGTLGAATTTTSAVAPIGNLSFPLATPASVGAKLNPNSTFPTSCDPYTGVLDNVFLDIA